MKRFIHSFALLLGGAIAVFAVPGLAQDLVVGEFASLTGSEATFGINSSNGVELAKKEINNSGGLLGGRKSTLW
jgi:branched-chain amino acid transport system substrate-binding protein